MHSTPPGTCQQCRWFEVAGEDFGECRFAPPVIIEKLVGGNSAMNIFQATKHPIVSVNDWCARFEPEKEVKEA